MAKKEEFKKIFTQILEPFALGLLALFFILPIVTVMNLTPITKQIKKIDVLGITTQDELIIRLVGGQHDVFSGESLNKIDETEYAYSTKIEKRGADSYSKPILEIQNNTEEKKTLLFWGQTLNNTKSKIYLQKKETPYLLQDNTGETYEQEISILPTEKVIIFLAVENLADVQFYELFDMTITVR